MLRVLSHCCHGPSSFLMGESVMDTVTEIVFVSISKIDHIYTFQSLRSSLSGHSLQIKLQKHKNDNGVKVHWDFFL
jgi:hypothetical protein